MFSTMTTRTCCIILGRSRTTSVSTSSSTAGLHFKRQLTTTRSSRMNQIEPATADTTLISIDSTSSSPPSPPPPTPTTPAPTTTIESEEDNRSSNLLVQKLNSTKIERSNNTTTTLSVLPNYPPLPALTPFSPIPPKSTSTHIATLTLRSYTSSLLHLTFFTQFTLRSARAFGIRTLGPYPQPIRTQLITVPRSPFAHKKSQQNFWRKTHSRRIEIYDVEEKVLEMWLGYLRKEGMGGVGVKVQRFDWREIGWASTTTSLKGEKKKKKKLQSSQQKEEKKVGLDSSSSSGGDEKQVETLAKQLQQEMMITTSRE